MKKPFLVMLLASFASCTTSVLDGGDPASEARAAIARGDFEEALAIVEDAVSERPSDPQMPEWLLARAEALAGLGRASEAVQEASGVLRSSGGRSVRGRAGLLVAELEESLGNHSNCLQALGSIDPEWLSESDADRARELAASSLVSVSSDVLPELRRQNWLEPYVLLETYRRRMSEGDADRAVLIRAEMDRLYPGFMERMSPSDSMIQPERAYIAVLLPMTGDGSVYAAQIEKGISLAFQRSADLLPQCPERVVFDTRGSRDGLVETAAQLASDPRCIAVLGPMTSRETAEIAGAASAGGLPFLSPSATSSEIDRMGDYVHRLVPGGTDEAVVMAEVAVRDSGCTRLAILHSYTQASVSQAEQFEATVTRMGAQVVATKGFNIEDTDFRNQIVAIRAQRPDGIFLPVTAWEAIQIAPQLRFYSLDVPMFGTSGWDSDVILRLGGESVEGAVFTAAFGTGSLYPPTARFVFNFRRQFSEEPTLLAAQGYDAAGMLLTAWSSGCRTRQSMEDFLKGLDHYDGASGRSTVGARTETRASWPLVRITGGEALGVE